MTVATARAKGLPVNEQIAKDQMRLIAGFLLENSAGGMENTGIPGVAIRSLHPAGMAAITIPAPPPIFWARYLRNLQQDTVPGASSHKAPATRIEHIEVALFLCDMPAPLSPLARKARYTKSIAAAVKMA